MGWESLGTDRPDFLTPRRTLFFRVVRDAIRYMV